MNEQHDKLVFSTLQMMLSDYTSTPNEEKRRMVLQALMEAPPAARYNVLALLLDKYALVDSLRSDVEELRGMVEALMSPPGLLGVMFDSRDHKALVSLSGRILEVDISSKLDINDLKVGNWVLLDQQQGCIIDDLGSYQYGEIGHLEKVLDNKRLLIDHRDTKYVVKGLDHLEDGNFDTGALVRFSPDMLLAFEVVEKREIETRFISAIPKATFDDIGGLDAEIIALREAIEYPLLYAGMISNYQILKARGIALFGPPGCGKTLLAQAIANRIFELCSKVTQISKEQLRLHFLSCKGPELLSMWVGESERALRELFQTAAKIAETDKFPAIIFFDECEALMRARANRLSATIDSTIVPQFLSLLDGFSDSGDIIVIAASNRLDLVDSAIMRPGRLGDLILEIPRPRKEAARSIFGKYFKPEIPLASDEANRKPEVDDFIRIALSQVFSPNGQSEMAKIVFRDGSREVLRRSDLVSGATIEKIVTRAKMRACRRDIKLGAKKPSGVRSRDLVEAIDEEFNSIVRVLKPHNLSEYIALPPEQMTDVVSIEPLARDVPVHQYVNV